MYEMTDLTGQSSIGILALMILIGAIAIWIRLKDKKSGFQSADEKNKEAKLESRILINVSTAILYRSILDS